MKWEEVEEVDTCTLGWGVVVEGVAGDGFPLDKIPGRLDRILGLGGGAGLTSSSSK